MPKRIVLGLMGAGGFAREVLPIAKDQLKKLAKPGAECSLYLVDPKTAAQTLNGVPILSEAEFFDLEVDERYFNVTIANSNVRARAVQVCLDHGAKPLALIADNSLQYEESDIGEGSILSAYSIIESNVRVGTYFHSNIYSYVAHECLIGDFVTFAPRVSCNGNVHIGDRAYIGAAAVIRNGEPERPLVIGEGAVVGMGAVVTKDVPAFTTVVGSPARPIGA